MYNLISVCINLCPCTHLIYTMFFKSIHPFSSIVNRVILIATCKQKMFRSLKKNKDRSSIFTIEILLNDEEITEDRKVATSQAKCANTTQHRPSRPTHRITSLHNTPEVFQSRFYIWWHSKFKGIFLLSKYYIALYAP